MNWTTIGRYHLNLNNIVYFKWQGGFLIIYGKLNEEIISLVDHDKAYYRKLCNACCMNMAEE